MNLSQLETLVWTWLDDVNGGYFTKTQVDVWLNNAQRECQKLLIQAGENYYVEKMSGSTVQNQDTYVLPADFKKCHKLEIVLQGTSPNEVRQTLSPVTLVQLDMISQTTGVPTAYNIRRNVVTIRPIPDNIYTMYLHQTYRVVDMVNSTDLPDVPQDYHEFLAILAAIDGFLRDQREPSAFLTGKRDWYMALMKQDADNRDLTAPKCVVVTEDMGGGYLF